MAPCAPGWGRQIYLQAEFQKELLGHQRQTPPHIPRGSAPPHLPGVSSPTSPGGQLGEAAGTRARVAGGGFTRYATAQGSDRFLKSKTRTSGSKPAECRRAG